MIRCWFLALALLPLSLACGCGPGSTSSVSGQVTLGGTPVAEGDIVFRDESQKTAPAAGKITAGKYQVETLPGAKRVEITAYKVTGERFDKMMNMNVEEREQYIPARYNTESELKVEVAAGQNTQDFPLEPAE